MSLRLLHYSDIENAYDDPERIGRLAGLLRDRRDDATIVAGTGDNTAPGVLSLVSDGRQSLDLYGAVEPDVETFGNHDFDHGLDATHEIVRRSPQTWLSANVRLDGDRFAADAGVEPWTIVEADGSRVGLFGLLDPATPSINPVAEPLTLTDPIEAARDAVGTLRDRGVDRIVALSHLGRRDDELAAEVEGIDAILGGHVHNQRVERTNGTLLTRPGVNGSIVLEVTLDDEPSAIRRDVADAPLAEDVAESLRARWQDAGLDEPVTTVEEPIPRTEAATHGGESRIGNAVADAYRWATDADVGLQNSGGIRMGEPLSGEITVADLISVIPFEEPIALASVTGAELRRILAEGDGSRIEFGEPDWWHAHVSGASIRLFDGEIERVTVRDEPLDPEATYTLATSEYLLYSDTEFPTLTESHRVDTGEVQYEVLIEFARRRGLDPSIEGRIVRS